MAKNPEKSKGPCPTKGCKGEIAFKGICRSCWGQAKTLVDAGDTTWEELERLGLVVLGDKPFRNLFFQIKNGPQPDEKGHPEKEPSTVPFPSPSGGYNSLLNTAGYPSVKPEPGSPLYCLNSPFSQHVFDGVVTFQSGGAEDHRLCISCGRKAKDIQEELDRLKEVKNEVSK